MISRSEAVSEVIAGFKGEKGSAGVEYLLRLLYSFTERSEQ